MANTRERAHSRLRNRCSRRVNGKSLMVFYSFEHVFPTRIVVRYKRIVRVIRSDEWNRTKSLRRGVPTTFEWTAICNAIDYHHHSLFNGSGYYNT